MEKVISFVVPCYNSANYMDKCIQSLIDLNSQSDDIEILIIDDGSNSDKTLEKALSWENNYPTIVRTIHQENGGHGKAINIGLKYAQGFYYKVVDSDDWLDFSGMQPVMSYLRKQGQLAKQNKDVTDMIIANFVYNKVNKNKQKEIDYCNVFPQNREFSWNDIQSFKINQFIFMHAVIYKTSLLKNIGLTIPEHSFYVDNIFVYRPLPFVKTIYYINTRMYMYLIGRSDQSVNEDAKKRQIDQQIMVTKNIIDASVSEKFNEYTYLKKYMINYLSMMISMCSVFLRMIDNEESKRKLKEIWDYLIQKDIVLYSKVRKSLACFCTNIPTKFGKYFCVCGYKIVQKINGSI